MADSKKHNLPQEGTSRAGESFPTAPDSPGVGRPVYSGGDSLCQEWGVEDDGDVEAQRREMVERLLQEMEDQAMEGLESDFTGSSLSLHSGIESDVTGADETPKPQRRVSQRKRKIVEKTHLDSDDDAPQILVVAPKPATTKKKAPAKTGTGPKSKEKEAAEPVAGPSRSLTCAGGESHPKELQHADRLGAIIEEGISAILEEIARSKNLKGGVIKNIKDAAKTIRAASETLVERSATVECAELRKENTRLSQELASQRQLLNAMRDECGKMRADMIQLQRQVYSSPDTQVGRLQTTNEDLERQVQQYCTENVRLKQQVMAGNCELRKLKREAEKAAADRTAQAEPSQIETPEETPAPTPSAGPSPAEDSESRLIRRIGELFNPRFALLEEGLLQVQRGKPPPKQGAAKNAPRPPANRAAAASKKGSLSQPAPVVRAENTEGAPSPSNNNREGWATVVRRGKRSRTTNAQSAPATQTNTAESAAASQQQAAKKKAAAERRRRKRRFKPPSSSAIAITIDPAAEEGGLTYESVLREAKDKISLADLGITDLRFRLGVTGCRILEVPGADTGDKANSLAARLAEIVPGGSVRVTRPEKSAELRISDLDDSATAEDVVAAVVRQGGCAELSVKAGEVRRTPSGVGTIWVRCPVAAAKALTEAGRVKVGWTMARVQSLDPRPMRCYRCLLTGHVGRRCTAGEDCSDKCYRCGQGGHKAARCAEPSPKCWYCAAANRKSDHRVGSTKACRLPKARAAAAAQVTGGGGDSMDT
ncbi:myosin-11-like [Achroia grisella]|uniref:myosin-11-like n=1 Tax=Achroia grisella TaxID=688607 RepID=UPI0027D3018C|nr:myosin-11-like [Achroia grisella]